MQEPEGKSILIGTIWLQTFLLICIRKLTKCSNQQVCCFVLRNKEKETLLWLCQEPQYISDSLKHSWMCTCHWKRQQQSNAFQEMVTVKISEKKTQTTNNQNQENNQQCYKYLSTCTIMFYKTTYLLASALIALRTTRNNNSLWSSTKFKPYKM